MKRFVSVLLLFLSFLSGKVEAAVFTGQILSVDSVAIPYATVYLPQLKQGTMTDVEGKWNLSDVPDGTYLVEYSYMGYEMQSEEIALRAMAPHTWLPVSRLFSFDMGSEAKKEGMDQQFQQITDSLNALKAQPDLTKKQAKEVDEELERVNMAKGLMSFRVEFATSFKYSEVIVK